MPGHAQNNCPLLASFPSASSARGRPTAAEIAIKGLVKDQEFRKMHANKKRHIASQDHKQVWS